MSFKTWILILVDIIVTSVLIKILFKKISNFFKTFWYMEQRSSITNPVNDYTSPRSIFKTIFIVIIVVLLIVVEYKIFY
jgi:hypothetical protein